MKQKFSLKSLKKLFMNNIVIIISIIVILISLFIQYNYGIYTHNRGGKYRLYKKIYNSKNDKSMSEGFLDIAGVQKNKEKTSWTNTNEKTITSDSSNDSLNDTSNNDENTNNLNQCELGGLCSTEEGWGIYNFNCECIVKNKDKNINLNMSSRTQGNRNDNNLMNNNSIDNIKDELEQKDEDCLPNSTDFDLICQKKNPLFQVINLKKCNDNESKPICGMMPNSKKPNIVKTPCLNKSDDFNSWCRYFSNKNPPIGYNVNSIGAKEVLVGEKGGCYTNGKADNSKARAICTYNYTDEIIKLEPANHKIDYNVFTNCKYMKRTDYVKECSKLLDVDYSDAYADQITSYDCNPGFGRAKCLKKEDRLPYNNNFQNVFNMNTSHNNIKINECTCYNS